MRLLGRAETYLFHEVQIECWRRRNIFLHFVLRLGENDIFSWENTLIYGLSFVQNTKKVVPGWPSPPTFIHRRSEEESITNLTMHEK